MIYMCIYYFVILEHDEYVVWSWDFKLLTSDQHMEASGSFCAGVNENLIYISLHNYKFSSSFSLKFLWRGNDFWETVYNINTCPHVSMVSVRVCETSLLSILTVCIRHHQYSS